MVTNEAANRVELEVTESEPIDELVLGFREGGELHELVTMDAPATATIERNGDSSLVGVRSRR